jgi:hypothetical protein
LDFAKFSTDQLIELLAAGGDAGPGVSRLRMTSGADCAAFR